MNDLFREVLEGRIPMPRRRIRPGIYLLSTPLADATAPTMRELEAGVNAMQWIGDAFSESAWRIDAMAKAMTTPPAPTYPIGNIATQKRRKRL